jgi:hypothetical protein
MLSNFHAIVFDESAGGERFLGFTGKSTLSDLPLWGNFRIADILRATNFSSVPHTILRLENPSDGEPLLTLLGSPKTGKHILLGRTGNPAALDWVRLTAHLRKPRGIVKVQVGKLPSDLYCLEKRKLKELAAACPNGDFLRNLFDRVLFECFERIVECAGFSFHLRNSYEYYRENLMIVDRLKDEEFQRGLYEGLEAQSSSHTVVGDRAVIRDSYLGSGAVVHGSVEGSVVFGGVTVGRNTTIRSSVILPFNRIEEGVRIENALVLGGRDRTIERGSSIGGGDGARNADYPTVIKEGLTVIGESVNIPSRSRIGSGCLVYGRLEHGKPEQTRNPIDVKDGETFTP